MSFNIDKVAHLAHLEISNEKKMEFQDKIEGMLSMIEGLMEIRVENTEKEEPIPMTLRQDTIFPSLQRGQVLENAPQVEAGCVVVPKTVE